MSIQTEENKLKKLYKPKNEKIEDQKYFDNKIIKTSPNLNFSNNTQESNDINIKKNLSKKRLEKLNVNYAEAKNQKEKSILKSDNSNKFSSLTPKNTYKIPNLSKNLNIDKIQNNLSSTKKSKLESERSKKQRHETSLTVKYENKETKRNDTSTNNLNKTREDKKSQNQTKNKNSLYSTSPLSHNALISKKNSLLKSNQNNLQTKLIKESKSSQQLIKNTNANGKINSNQEENQIENQNKAPLIDLATDFYEGADVVEIDMGISCNSSINNNSLLNSKNYNEELFKNSKLDSLTKQNNNSINDLEIFEGSLEDVYGKENEDEENSINEFKLNLNVKDNSKEKKILIEDLDEINIEDNINKSSPKKYPYDYKSLNANGIQSSPSTKNFLLNNLNSTNSNVKYLKTNFESTKNINTNFNINSNKNIVSKKCTTKNNFVTNNNNTNTNKNILKSNEISSSNINTNYKTKEKFPHSKTLKILKNNNLNFMNNTFKVLSEKQGNLNFNKFEKAKTLLNFSKEKDNQALSFRISNKSNNSFLKNFTSLKKDALKNTCTKEPITQVISKKNLKGFESTNFEKKRTTSNNRNLLSNKLVFNTTTDLKKELKKPYSQDKNLSKRKFNTDKSINKKDIKGSISKNNLNSFLHDDNHKYKKLVNANLKNNNNKSEKKFERGKTENFKTRVNRKSIGINPLIYKNNTSSNTTNLNINCTINNTNPDNACVFSINHTIGNTNTDKNFSDKNNISNNKKSANKLNNNINNDKKPKINNYINTNKNKRENSQNQKLTHNISQKYLKQFFSSLSNNTIIGNVNVNISNSNLKITQNIPAQENQNFNSSFKSNYINSQIPGKNNIEISFESADESNINENAFIEENPKLMKSVKMDKSFKRKSLNSPPLILAKKAINKMLNRPVSEYKLIKLNDYNITDDNQILLNCRENFNMNVPSKNQVLTENNTLPKNNLNTLKNNLSDKHFDRININFIEKNAKNLNKGRINNTYRNTLNLNLNGKKNFFTKINNNSNSNVNSEKDNTFSSNKKKIISSSKQATSGFKKIESEIKSNDANLTTKEANIFKGKLEDYTIGKEIGKGAYAIVKQATHKPTNKKFAIKIYEKVKLLDPERKGSVKREIQILKKMEHHENIVKLIEVIETSRQILLVMELVEGISLLDLLKSRENRRIDENECRKIYSQLVNSIAFCHSKNIIHRDIKLENIIVDSNFNLKLIDFGFGAVSPSSKLQSFFCGTPSYMPPEIVQKKEYLGYLADIWSLGILLFTLLCGAFPFRANSEKELYAKITKGVFSCPEHLSQSVCELIRKILVIKPADRPTAQEILNDKWFNSFYSHHKNVKDCIILEENELNFNSKNN